MDTNYIEGKLNKFTTLVLTDAHEKCGKILSDVEKRYSESIDEKETELLGGAYESIQRTVASSRREASEKVLHTEMESKRKLILKREEIIDNVMREAAQKLAGFTKSDDYEKWLLRKTENAFAELGEGKKTVYISAGDMRLKDKLEALAPNVTVMEAKRGSEGGVKVVNTDKKTAVDYTFKEMLDAEKRKFLQSSGLTLN